MGVLKHGDCRYDVDIYYICRSGGLEEPKMMMQFAVSVVLIAASVDLALAKGFGTDKKNKHTLPNWRRQHQDFEECQKQKCIEACKEKSYIKIGANKDYKQEVLSKKCNDCEVNCLPTPEGEEKHLVVSDEDGAKGKGRNATKMRMKIQEAKKGMEHRQAFKRGTSWRIRN